MLATHLDEWWVTLSATYKRVPLPWPERGWRQSWGGDLGIGSSLQGGGRRRACHPEHRGVLWRPRRMAAALRRDVLLRPARKRGCQDAGVVSWSVLRPGVRDGQFSPAGSSAA